MEHRLLIVSVFIITYILITVQRIPGLRIDRPSGVTIGSTLLLLTGLVTVREAYSFVDWDVITFLLGMMVIIAYLEFSGFFEHTALWLVRISRSTNQLLAATIAVCALLSAFFVNDTVCLLFTPILLKATSYLRLNPLPYLIAIATASNIGSALTITGNPQNMYIGVQSGMAFLKFIGVMTVPVVVGLMADYAVIRWLFRKDIHNRPLTPVAIDEIPPLKKRLMIKTLIVLGGVLILFISGTGYPLAVLAGMSVIFLIGRVPPREVLVNVNWTILLFFAGLFVVMGAFEKAGYMTSILSFTSKYFMDNSLASHLGLACITAFLSNIVSNVPAVILIQPVGSHFGYSDSFWLLLAMASTFAGNLTLIGSVANLIVAEKASSMHIDMGFMDYLKAGLPVTLITLIFGTWWLYVIL